MVKEQDVAVWIGFKWLWIDAVLVFLNTVINFGLQGVGKSGLSTTSATIK
jgi:hypothetical protein